LTKCARKNLKKAKSLATPIATRRAIPILKVVRNNALNRVAINVVVVVKVVVAVKIAVVAVTVVVAVKIVHSLLNHNVRHWRPRVVQMV